MKSQIAVYETHDRAVEAIKLLSHKNFPMKIVSLLGRAEVVEDHIQIKSLDTVNKLPAIVGMGAGTVVGLLSGIGVFAIPGFGFLYGAGALIGVIAGLDLGLIVGGLVSLLTYTGIKEEEVVKCQEHLKEGKFMVIVKGNQELVDKAKNILNSGNGPLEIIA